MRTTILITCFALAALLGDQVTAAFSLSSSSANDATASSRRAFLSKGTALVAAAAGAGSSFLGGNSAAIAAPEIFTLDNGIKYAIIKPAKDNKKPMKGDIVAIEYTGYLTDGTIFDATHSEGKKVSRVKAVDIRRIHKLYTRTSSILHHTLCRHVLVRMHLVLNWEEMLSSKV